MYHLVCIIALITSAYVLPSVADTEPEAQLNQKNEKCYELVGCFSIDPPYRSLTRPLIPYPQSPDKVNTQFLLFTRESIQDPQILDARYPQNALTVWTNFKSRPTIFIIHGFLDTIKFRPWMKEMAIELLKFGVYNVIIVDWSGGNQFPYNQATANTRLVGAQISLLINHLIKAANITAEDFHIIGHSLGAQTAGYAGERIDELGRISGLDPAGPYFRDEDKLVRLDEGDAKQVDTIHSDMSPVLPFGFGTTIPSGHANFFPNGGHHQPGCEDSLIPNILDSGLILGVADFVLCSHVRAQRYYTESINSLCKFPAFPCANESDFKKHQCHDCGDVGCNYMGFHAVKPPEGQIVTYYLTTNDKPPFCRFSYTISIKLADQPGASVRGVVAVSFKGDVNVSDWVTLTGSTPVILAPGKTYWFDLDLTEDVGIVTAVAFWWEQSISLIPRPPRSVYVENIAIFEPKAGVIKKLCAEDPKVTSDSTLVLSEPCD